MASLRVAAIRKYSAFGFETELHISEHIRHLGAYAGSCLKKAQLLIRLIKKIEQKSFNNPLPV